MRSNINIPSQLNLKRNLVLIILVGGIFWAGCMAPFVSKTPLEPVPPENLVHSIGSHASQLRSFQGTATLSVVSTEGAFQGSMRVIAKMPDSLWLKVEGPLGVDMAIGRFGGGRVELYSPWENVLYEGTFEDARHMGVLPMDMGFANMTLGVIGLLVPDWLLEDSTVTLTTDSKYYVVDMGFGEKMWIEPKGPVVTRWERRMGDDELLWLWEGKEFKKEKGIRIPQVIRMTNYEPRQRVTLVYERVRANRRLKKDWCEIKVPEGVQTIEL